MSPYSMPLWTILTKWPAPEGPQWRYPSSAVPAEDHLGTRSERPLYLDNGKYGALSGTSGSCQQRTLMV